MKKLISFFILLSVLCCSTVAHSESVEETDPLFVLLDVLLYRPGGLAITIAGTGLFIGLSPLTALASIPAPHDAFLKTSNILIRAPAAYTFIRPIGDRDYPYNEPPAIRNNAETYNMTVTPGQRPVAPVAPKGQQPQRYPDTGKGL
ncbi:MAG: hypothetical protein ACXWTS_00460 [Methylococcaceae bacterium]